VINVANVVIEYHGVPLREVHPYKKFLRFQG